MSDVPNQNGNFNPAHEAHSIEQVLFVVQFGRPLTDEELLKVRQSTSVFKVSKELPATTELQGFTINMGMGAPMPVQNGFMLYRTGPDGTVEKELRIERNSVTFRTTHYSRWENIWNEAKKYFEPIIPLFSTNNKATGISLNVFDKFIWSGAIEKCSAEALLSRESKYLCPYLFENKDLWHSHTGAFIRVDDQTKRLININIDSLDEIQGNNPCRVVVIATVLTDLLNQPGYTPYDLEEINSMAEIESKFQELHIYGNGVFGNIINYDISKRIALID